jgi:hypothetical protein
MSSALKINYPTSALEQRYQELYNSGCKKLGKFATLCTGKDPRDTALLLATSLVGIVTTVIGASIWLGTENLKSIYLLLLTPITLLLIDSVLALYGHDTLSLKTTRYLIFFLGWKEQGSTKVPATTVLSNDLVGRKAKKYLKTQHLTSVESETFYTLISQWEGNLDSLVTLCKKL